MSNPDDYINAYIRGFKKKVVVEAETIDRSPSWIIREGLKLYFDAKKEFEQEVHPGLR